MTLKSEIFDSIRIKPKDETKKAKKARASRCSWDGCNAEGNHKAPKGRGQEGAYHVFCIDHVRAYNKSYNYFSGMNDDMVWDYMKENATGHRPTWAMGTKHQTHGENGNAEATEEQLHQQFHDSFHFSDQKQSSENSNKKTARKRKIQSLDQRALENLFLPLDSDPRQIKSQYKNLVKKYHPDTNGGDRSTEEKLREVISAYNQLKKSGFVD